VAQYSHTKLSCYLQCPKKYEFRYVEGVEPPERTIELHLGSVVHQSLQKLYADLQIPKLNSESEILDFYHQQWNATLTPATRVVRTRTTARDYLNSGRAMLSNYYRRFYPFSEANTVGLEVKVSFPVAAAHSFQGVIDRLVNVGDNCYEIHDYKTSRRLPSLNQIKSDAQLTLYEIAVRHQWPDAKRVSLVWHYLAHGKEIREGKTASQLEAARQEALGVIAKIEAARSFPTKVTPLCDWCEYRSICLAIVAGAPAASVQHHSSGRVSFNSAHRGCPPRTHHSRRHQSPLNSVFRSLGRLLGSIVRFLAG
jgi:putative RecB family exonuclease